MGSAFSYSHLSFNHCFVQDSCRRKSTGPAYWRTRTFATAVAMAIDKDQLVERILRGYGEPGTTMVVPSADPWHWEPPTRSTFDIEGANALLDQAGYVDTNDDGMRDDPASGTSSNGAWTCRPTTATA